MKRILICVLLFTLVAASLSGCTAFIKGIEEVSKGISKEVVEETANKFPYEKGVLTETDFESRYLDLRFSIPEGFIMATQDDINDLMDLGADVAGFDEKLVDFASLVNVYEMMASASSGSPNVIVMTEKIPLSNMTVEQYLDALKTQLSKVNEMNYEYDDDITSIEIAGQSYKQLTTTTGAYGQNLTQKYNVRKIDKRMLLFITTSTPDTEEELAVLMNRFEKF